MAIPGPLRLPTTLLLCFGSAYAIVHVCSFALSAAL